MEILIVLAVVSVVLAITNYLRKRAFKDFASKDQPCSGETENVTS